MPADFWPNAWFALGVTAVSIAPAGVSIAVDAVGLRRPVRPGTVPLRPWQRVANSLHLAFSWVVLSGMTAWIVGLVGFSALSGPGGEPVHIGEVTEVDYCSRNLGALWLAYQCDIWVEAATPEEHDVERFRTVTTAAIALEPGDPVGLWPGEELGDGRWIWDIHPLAQAEQPFLRPGQAAALIATAALAAVSMLVWAGLRPVGLGDADSFFDGWGSGGDGDAGGGDGGGD